MPRPDAAAEQHEFASPGDAGHPHTERAGDVGQTCSAPFSISPRAHGGGRPRLTEKQRWILDFVVEFLRKNGAAPTLREIGARFGIRSTNGVDDHLTALEKKGYIRREMYGSSRAIRIVREDGDVLCPTCGR